MKNFIYLISFSVFLFSCQGRASNEASTLEEIEELVVGSDVDENGCINSAGYLWSKVKKDCVRIWEVGTPFFELRTESIPESDSPQVVYVILADDQSQVELFFTDGNTVILNKSEDVSHGLVYGGSADTYNIQLKGETYWILDDKKEVYFNKMSEENSFASKL
jgi:hypothetical protein